MAVPMANGRQLKITFKRSKQYIIHVCCQFCSQYENHVVPSKSMSVRFFEKQIGMWTWLLGTPEYLFENSLS